MAEIARRAGVGSATLYRNFANRRQLLEALYVDEIDAVCEAAATIGGDTPGASLTAWLHRFYAYFTSKRLVAAELLKHSDADDPVFGTGYTRVLDAGRPLLLAAQASGETRSTLTLEQILDMVAAIAKIPGDDQLPRADPAGGARLARADQRRLNRVAGACDRPRGRAFRASRVSGWVGHRYPRGGETRGLASRPHGPAVQHPGAAVPLPRTRSQSGTKVRLGRPGRRTGPVRATILC